MSMMNTFGAIFSERTPPECCKEVYVLARTGMKATGR